METTSVDESTPATELAHNLPAIVAQLKALREDMERKSKLYDSLLGAVDARLRNESTASAPASFDTNQYGTPGGMYGGMPGGMPGGMYGGMYGRMPSGSSKTFADSYLDPRASPTTLKDLSALNTVLKDANYTNTMASRQYSRELRQKQKIIRQASRRARSQTRSTSNISIGEMVPDKYTVMWVSGECGISLRNFSKKANKVGAQIALLQHADGVTTGIGQCRLGDQLLSINDEQVDTLRFKDIVEKLKTAERPVSMSFCSNTNVQTSPRASNTLSRKFSTTMEDRSVHHIPRGGSWKMITNTKETSPDRNLVRRGGRVKADTFFDDESGDVVQATIDRPELPNRPWSSSGEAASVDRNMTSSNRSSSSALSDDVEFWCREQEEMHTGIIVLLTETVVRCEKLQQESLDQLQNLMQLSVNSPL